MTISVKDNKGFCPSTREVFTRRKVEAVRVISPGLWGVGSIVVLQFVGGGNEKTWNLLGEDLSNFSK